MNRRFALAMARREMRSARRRLLPYGSSMALGHDEFRGRAWRADAIVVDVEALVESEP